MKSCKSKATRVVVIFRFVLFVLALGLTSSLWAAVYTGAIATLEVWKNGNVAFILAPTVSTCNQQFILNQSDSGAKNQYAALLAAKSQGRQVTVNSSGCGPADNYGGSYNLVTYLYVLDY